MSNKKRARALTTRSKAVQARITAALMRAAKEPFKYAGHIPVLQMFSFTAISLAARIDMLELVALGTVDAAAIATRLAALDAEFADFETMITDTLQQIEE